MANPSSGFSSATARCCGQVAGLLLLIFSVAAGSPSQSTTRDSSSVEQRVNSILNRMTLEQKIDYIGGVNGYSVRGLPEFGVPAFLTADASMGVRNYGPATAMPAGIGLAATWDPALAERMGTQIGRDARAKGVNFLLGPGLNIYRAPMNGRNFEYLGEDPLLASRIAARYIDGLQSQGVSATVKHFMGNNSEFDRHNVDDVIDERTMREIYLPAFEAAVKDGHVGAVMDSYNLVNGQHMTENAPINCGILKKEWGFQGVLMSDWASTYNGIAAANACLDLEMPFAAFMNRQTLLPAINDGKVSIATIDEKVRRILTLAVKSHWLDRNQQDLSIPRYNLEGDEVALEGARESIVLLKNTGNLLPLDKHTIKSIAVIGPDAYPPVPVGGGSAGVRPFAAVSFLEGISKELGSRVPTYYHRGIPPLNELAQSTNFLTAASGGASGLNAEYFSSDDLTGDPISRQTVQHINFGEVANGELGLGAATLPADVGSARWTGYYIAPSSGAFDVFVQSTGEAGGSYRVYVDNNLALDNWIESRALVGITTLTLDAGPHKVVVEHHGRPSFLGSRFRFGIARQGTYVEPDAEKMAASADAVVVCVGFSPESESEASDRTFGLPPGQDELIQKLTAINKRVIVVVISGGSFDATPWIDGVPALLEAWYPGQEGGTALAQILFGDADPSGRLPISFERKWDDNPVHDSYYPQPGTNRVVYKEGVFVGYRGYEHNGVKPLFPFAYGLSYTTFRYGNLSIRPAAASASSDPSDPAPRYEASWDVTNTGSRDGADVLELYIGEDHPAVPRPGKELKGFARVNLRPGQTQRVRVALDARSFAYYDVHAHRWRVDPGSFTVSVGQSVDQIQLKQTIWIPSAVAFAATRQP
jgi:beta-glucosidase